MSCKNHTAWLQLATSSSASKPLITVNDTSQLEHIINTLPDSATQTPSLLLFLGKGHKNVALRHLFPHNNFRKPQSDSFLGIRVETTSRTCQSPIIFADGYFTEHILAQQKPASCHKSTAHVVNWPCTEHQTIMDALLSRVVLPFVSVLTIFVDDCDALEDIRTFLTQWDILSSTFPKRIRARLIVVSSQKDQTGLRKICAGLLNNTKLFSQITTFIIDERLSQLARHRPLKEEILRQTDQVKNELRQHCWLFSARHLNALIKAALAHSTVSLQDPFYIVQATRVNHSLNGSQDHISTIIKAGREGMIMYEDIIRFLASSFFMDAYPAGGHSFAPRHLYRLLYRPSFIKASSEAFNESMGEYQSRRVEKHFCALFKSLKTVPASSSRTASIGNYWKDIKTTKSCLFCCLRVPQHMLSCGHAICDTCVRIFGDLDQGKEYNYTIAACILCGTTPKPGALKVRIKPPTAGTRVLSIDGGGIRGVVPLECLLLIQKALGTCRLQDFFDISIGTSSGGLIALTLSLYNWSVHQCDQTFNGVFEQFFRKTQDTSGSLIRRWRNHLRTWITDGQYNTANLETQFQRTFGATRRLRDPATSAYAGAKVAVTATNITDCSAFLFSNYNSMKNIDESPFVWEAARATSAAPILFQVAHLDLFGTYQDGAMKNNNPIILGLCESQLIWPGDCKEDIVLSLGTGTEQDQSPHAPHFRHILKDGFIPRIGRYIPSSMDGEVTWNAVISRLDPETRKRYFRFNVHLNEPAAIDDTSMMPKLREAVNTQPHISRDIQEFVFSLLIASFFFELDCVPQFDNGFYRCEGSIRCRNDSPKVLELLAKLSPRGLDFIIDSTGLGDLEGPADICTQCSRFRKRVIFHVRHPTEIVTIYVRVGHDHRYAIGGFPHSMQWLVQQQYLDSVFGLPDHRSSNVGDCERCRAWELPMKRNYVSKSSQLVCKRLRIS
ncbi:FabD/lysophospholipase-like protein [Mytilinidion resinicola]|uniref:FabD/lysophospholipase-like protein n=1 Tax=Mytilinidion resinicola TaxID=574789 RepID=A0A6A6YY26_9PEZI|nr:FabD/lysophospholipase-like protein [Mytilinidion resinicola]KAF2812825.1 FabD/lysophospholipase-like protein [Mytilinidion resinicola]